MSLLRSGLRFGWALSLSGAEGLARVVGGEPAFGDDGVAEDLARQWRSALGEPASSDGNRNPGEGWPSIESWLAPGPARQEWLGIERRLVDGVHEMAATARVLLPSKGGRLALRALENQLAAYGHFRRAATLAPGAPLVDRLALASEADGLDALWLYEGLGYDHAERNLCLERPGPEEPRSLPADLPTACLATLHTGVGLSLARRRLDRSHVLDPAEEPSDGNPADHGAELLRRTLDDGAHLAAPGCGGIFVETLGFATRLLRPAWLPILDRALARPSEPLPEGARALFWHGVGRATSFGPRHLVPGLDSLHGALDGLQADMAAVGADSPDVRANALAGLAWAVALVQVPEPAVLASTLDAWNRALDGPDGDRWERRAIVDGIVSMGLLWWQGSGGEAGSGPGTAQRDFFRPRDPLWTDWVSTPMERALVEAAGVGAGSIPPEALYRFADRGSPP